MSLRLKIQILVLIAIWSSTSFSLEITTSRSPTNPKTENAVSKRQGLNRTSGMTYDVLDVRTPPRIKVQEKIKKQHQEYSYPGEAIPLDEDFIELEERPLTEKSTTTWILLSGQMFSTSVKPPLDEKKESMAVASVDKLPTILKPHFVSVNHKNKKRNENVTLTKENQNKTTGLNEVEKQTSKNNISSSSTTTLISNLGKKTTNLEKNNIKKPNENKPNENKPNENKNSTDKPESSSTEKNGNVTVEAKDAAISLNDEKTKKEPSNKKKKNKNRRKKPAEKTNTGISNPINLIKDGTVSNQLYSYISREIVPTIGVGLVGLVVTAGLASYFLYPFGAISRSSDIDRKDSNVNKFYYKDKYSGGIPEEDAIGEVIAGMPANLFINYFLKTSTPKNSQLNKVYRSNNEKPKYQNIKGTVETVPFTFDKVSERVTGYKNDFPNTQNEKDNSIYNPTEKPLFLSKTEESKTKETDTVKMSEHGPRSLKY